MHSSQRERPDGREPFFVAQDRWGFFTIIPRRSLIESSGPNSRARGSPDYDVLDDDKQDWHRGMISDTHEQ